MTRRLVVNASDYSAAKRIREDFMDAPMREEIPIRWKWPRTLEYVGRSEAVQYTSDKWKRRGDYEDYKHVAEGPQELYVRDGFLRDWRRTSDVLELPSETTEIPKGMPTAFAELAPILGFQFQPLNERFQLSGKYYGVDIARAYIGAGRFQKTGDVFLCIYTREALCAIITGTVLGVEKDGIVG